MKYRKPIAPGLRAERRSPAWRRQCALGLLGLTLLTACDTTKQPEFGEIGAVAGFIGGAVVEEPHAALAARDALSAGGTAADAMVAAFFTMVATYPVGAGLGGGGACVYYDAVTNTAETLDFQAVAPRGGGAVAIPGTIRGMALLHSRYGRLRFGQLVQPGETLARFGHLTSRALAKRLEPLRDRLAADPFLERQFLRADGGTMREGEELRQVELAATLTRIRTRGIGAFYGGRLGKEFVEAAAAADGQVTIEDLRDYRAVWRGVQKTPVGDHMLYHLQSPPPAGDVLRDATRAALKDRAGTSAPAPDGFAALKADDAGLASAVVADRRGSAVSCVFTMHRDFGLARVAPTMGMVFAPAADSPSAPLSPVLAANENIEQAFFVASAGGGSGGLWAVARLSADVLQHGLELEDAMNRPRRMPAGPQGQAGVEQEGGELRIGRVQAIWCSLGIKRAPKTCSFISDPRGYGLAGSQVF